MYNLIDLIDTAKNLDDIAVIDESRTVTYKQLLELIDKVSSYLIDQNINKGDIVAIYDFNSIDFIAIFLGILKIGAIALPINPTLPKSIIEFILQDSKPKMIMNNVPDHLSRTHIPPSTVYNDPAFILYTSGSTGIPKGVVVPHSHKWIILERAKNSPKRKIIVAAPSYHMNGLSNIEFSLATHSILILMKKFDPKIFISNILKYKINTISSVPTMLHLILDEKEMLEQNNFDFVKHITMASSPINYHLISQLKSYFPNAIISNAYGLTEVGPGVFGKHPSLPTPELSVGYPREGIEYRLVDNVLEIRSPSMMLKYSNTESKNLTHDGFFITNDIFEIDDNGFYFFKGRKDDMFVCGGHNIYPKEIEKIIEEYPGIDSAVVVGIEDKFKGIKPYSFIKTKPDLDLTDLKRFLHERLPYYSCPREIWIKDNMPLNHSKKIDLALLKQEAKIRIENLY